MGRLEEIYAKIAGIDAQIADFYEKRIRLAKEASAYRREQGGGAFGFVQADALDFSAAKAVFQGTEGAYSQQALREFFGTDVKCAAVGTWQDAMEAITGGRADYAVLPIENSSAGIVSENFDLLAEYDVAIVGEQILKIDHCLLGVKGAKLSGITEVYSHPQALMQCSKYLKAHPAWQQHGMENTAGSAKKVMEGKKMNQAAIASGIAADIYGLCVLAEGIQNHTSNSTKFIIVTGRRIFQKKASKISICFEIPHKSGSLYGTLSHFIHYGLNMSKIESRPIQGRTWEYRFFVDFDGNLADGAVQDALHGLEGDTERLRILGNY